MIIGLNGNPLTHEFKAGVEVYTLQMYRALLSRESEDCTYRIYSERPIAQDVKDKLTFNSKANIEFKVIPKLLSWTQISLARELYRNPVDIYFTPIHTLPLIRSNKLKVIAVIHGLEYEYSNVEKPWIWKILLSGKHEKYVLRKADAVVVPSEATFADIHTKKWTYNKIVVIHEGLNSGFYPRAGLEITRFKNKYGIDAPYLAFFSTIQPRKNIERLIEAFGLFLKNRQPNQNIKLVLGGGFGWHYHEIVKTPEKCDINESVIFLGRLPDEDVPLFLSGSEAYVNCAYKEGFGLTLLEALSCGCKTLVSDIPAFRELGGSILRYVDPYNVESISRGISKILEDNSTPNIAIDRAKMYSWDHAAELLKKLFFESLKKHD